MSKWLDINLRELDMLPELFKTKLLEVRELDSLTKRLSSSIAAEETALYDELKAAMKGQSHSTTSNKKFPIDKFSSDRVVLGEETISTDVNIASQSKSSANDIDTSPTPIVENDASALSSTEEIKINSPKSENVKGKVSTRAIIDESYFVGKRDALIERRAELSVLMEKQLQISNNLYEVLDRKILILNSAFSLVDSLGFTPVANETIKQKKRKNMTEAELFEMAIEMAMKDHKPIDPVYCTCKRISFGEMIACENVDCPIEWFHYFCVGITSAPDIWYCPQCAVPST